MATPGYSVTDFVTIYTIYRKVKHGTLSAENDYKTFVDQLGKVTEALKAFEKDVATFDLGPLFEKTVEECNRFIKKHKPLSEGFETGKWDLKTFRKWYERLTWVGETETLRELKLRVDYFVHLAPVKAIPDIMKSLRQISSRLESFDANSKSPNAADVSSRPDLVRDSSSSSDPLKALSTSPSSTRDISKSIEPEIQHLASVVQQILDGCNDLISSREPLDSEVQDSLDHIRRGFDGVLSEVNEIKTLQGARRIDARKKIVELDQRIQALPLPSSVRRDSGYFPSIPGSPRLDVTFSFEPSSSSSNRSTAGSIISSLDRQPSKESMTSFGSPPSPRSGFLSGLDPSRGPDKPSLSLGNPSWKITHRVQVGLYYNAEYETRRCQINLQPRTDGSIKCIELIDDSNKQRFWHNLSSGPTFTHVQHSAENGSSNDFKIRFRGEHKVDCDERGGKKSLKVERLDYKLKNATDYRVFQEALHRKQLIICADVKKITDVTYGRVSNNVTTQCETACLRLWEDIDHTQSLLYFANRRDGSERKEQEVLAALFEQPEKHAETSARLWYGDSRRRNSFRKGQVPSRWLEIEFEKTEHRDTFMAEFSPAPRARSPSREKPFHILRADRGSP